jgi:hypothetical protein
MNIFLNQIIDLDEFIGTCAPFMEPKAKYHPSNRKLPRCCHAATVNSSSFAKHNANNEERNWGARAEVSTRKSTPAKPSTPLYRVAEPTTKVPASDGQGLSELRPSRVRCVASVPVASQFKPSPRSALIATLQRLKRASLLSRSERLSKRLATRLDSDVAYPCVSKSVH